MGLGVEDVSVRFSSGDKLVVDRVSLQANAGEITSILGPTGSGKTTLLLAIAGLIDDKEATLSGAVSLGGRSVALPARWKFPISIAFQQPTFFPWMTLYDNLESLHQVQNGSPTRRAQTESRVRGYLEAVGLLGFAHLRPFQLSGGMQARANLARALSFVSAIALLDEPFASLDEIMKERLASLVLRHTSENDVSAVMVTHDIRDAVRYSHTIYIMSADPLRCAEVWRKGRRALDTEELHDEVRELCEKHWYPTSG